MMVSCKRIIWPACFLARVLHSMEKSRVVSQDPSQLFRVFRLKTVV